MKKVEINGKTLHLSPNFELPEGVSLEGVMIVRSFPRTMILSSPC